MAGKPQSPDRRQRLVAVFDRHDEQRDRADHARGQRHVRDALARYQAEEGGRADDEQREPGEAPTDQPREHPPHRHQPEHRGEDERQPDRDHRPRVVLHLAGVAAVVGEPHRLHRRGHHPEREHRLGPEPFVLPVGVDPVVVLQHPPRDLAIVGLPRIDERVLPDPGYEHRERDDRDQHELEAERAPARPDKLCGGQL